MSTKKRELKRAAAEAAAAEEAARLAREHTMKALAANAAAFASDAQHRTMGLIGDAQRFAGPLAKGAAAGTVAFAARQKDAFEPHLKDALDRVAPAVDAAREKMADDLLPKAQHLLQEAVEHPRVAEVARRGQATVMALKGDLSAPDPVVIKEKRGIVSKLAMVTVVAATLGGLIAALRHFLAPKDDGWTAHEPSKAYVNNGDTFATAAKFADSTPSRSAAASSTDSTPAESGAPTDAETGNLVTDEPIAEPAGVEPELDVAPTSDAVDGGSVPAYGDGSYIGENPPEGFTIKGNERSKKYHVQGSGGYERTIAEVWFNSEDAATAAGFTRAQR